MHQRRFLAAFLALTLFWAGAAAPASAQEDAPAPTEAPAPAPTEPPAPAPTEPPAPVPTEPPAPAPTAPPVPPTPTTAAPGAATAPVEPTPGVERSVVTTPPDVTPGLSPADIARLQSLYDEAVAEEAVALAAYQESEQRLLQVDAEVTQLEHNLGVVEQQIQVAQAKVMVSEVLREGSEEELAAVQEELDGEQGDLRAQAVEAYVAGGRKGSAELEIFGQGLINDLAAAKTYGEVLLGTQQELIDYIEALEAEAEAVAQAMAEAEQAALEAREEVAARQADLREKEQRLLELRADVVQLIATNREALAEIQSEKAGYEERLNYLQNDSDGIAQVLRDVQGSQPRADILPQLSPPTVNAYHGSAFGARLHPIFGTVRMHNGIDMGAAMGEEIRAAAAGTVVYAQRRSGYGLVTVIDHGGQVATLYAHQSAFAAVEGQTVARGELIGYIGSTGFSTGPHLHFEVRLLGDPINPASMVTFGEPWPTPCAVLQVSDHPADVEAYENREDCQLELLEEARRLAEQAAAEQEASEQAADADVRAEVVGNASVDADARDRFEH